MKNKFRAVSYIPETEMGDHNIPHDDAVVTGYLIGENMIVGETIQKEDGTIGFEWTCTVFEDTIEPAFKLSLIEKIKYVTSIIFNKSWIG